jgi:hypothetical protein
MSKRPHTAADFIKDPSKDDSVERQNDSDQYAGMSTDDIQRLLDCSVDELSHEWKGTIYANVYPIMDKAAVTEATFAECCPVKVNICDYINGQKRPMQRLYFPPEKYPPPPNDAAMKSKEAKWKGWIDLKQDLETSAHDHGNPIFSNGSSNKTGNNRVFICA